MCSHFSICRHFIFENTIHQFNGSSVSLVGGVFYAGLGNAGKPGVNGAGELYAQYQSNGTNKISKLEDDTSTHFSIPPMRSTVFLGLNMSLHPQIKCC